MTAPALIRKLWSYCNILRDDGLSFCFRFSTARQDGDCFELLTFLLFIKTADEQSRLLYSDPRMRLNAASTFLRMGPRLSQQTW